MRALDLFSGIGGISLGLERAGIDVIAHCEADDYCRRVLANRWPAVPVFTDVRSIPRIGGVELVAGGVPCQPASTAGKRRGRADDRWLWPAFLEVVQVESPRWVLAENPLGLVSLKPDGLDWVCRSLRDLGFDPWPVVISANDVGAPHLRKRVWIVAHADRGAGRPQEGTVIEGHGDTPIRAGETEPGRCGRALAHADRRRCESERQPEHADEQRALRARSHGCSAPGPRDGAPGANADREPARHDDDAIFERSRPDARPDESGRNPLQSRGWWDVEPDVGRVVDGISAFMDCVGGVPIESAPQAIAGKKTAGRAHRLRALGNAAVPQVVEIIGRAILKADRESQSFLDTPSRRASQQPDDPRRS